MKIHALILAAGKGTRLGLINLPKALLTVKDKPLVFCTLETLQKLPLTSINIVIGYLGDMVKKEITAHFDNINYFTQDPLNGPGGAVLQSFAESDWDDDDLILVMNTDDSWLYTDTDFQKLLAKASPDKLALFITPDEHNYYSYYLKILLDKNGKFKDSTDKPIPGEYIPCGCYLATKRKLTELINQLEVKPNGEIGLFRIVEHDKANIEPVVIPYSHWKGINTLAERAQAERELTDESHH